VELKRVAMATPALVDGRTGARHADGRLGGLWNRHGLKRMKARLVAAVVLFKTKQK
jgi:hypothetical protein